MSAKILVVDDDKEFLEILQESLPTHGFEVSLAQNGEEFRQQVFTSKPDLIILDIMLGESNGGMFTKSS